MLRTLLPAVVFLTVVAPWQGPLPGADQEPGSALRAIELRSHTGLADGLYQSQLLGPLDHPIAAGITLCGTLLPARVTAKGDCELDLKHSGAFHHIGTGMLSLSVPDLVNKKPLAFKLFISKAKDGTWLYRNVTQVSFAIGEDIVSVIDANGDGIYNESGVDGMCWDGSSYLFPLPAPAERWCTAHAELSGLTFGPQGQHAKVSRRDLATVVPDTLLTLQDINLQRIHLGLTPRAENVDLSAPLQSHCQYMVGTSVLAHPETPGTPGYTAAGNEAGLNSILGQGTPPQLVATGMMGTFYHRLDVIRPNTQAFGLGHAGSFSGIDGRRDLIAGMTIPWPVLCPAPDQLDVPLAFNHESPDPLHGATSAGYPITAYFGTEVTIVSASLSDLIDGAPTEVPCFLYDATQGGEITFNRYQQVAGMIPKAPLSEGHTYEVSMEVKAAGGPWRKTWRFTTTGGRDSSSGLRGH